MDPLAPLTGQSAQLRSTETCREVAADHEAPSQTNAAAKAARALGGGSRECHYSKLWRGRLEAEARAFRTRRGPRCTIAGKPSGAETDARCRPPFALEVSLATRTRGPDTARRKPRPCQEDSCQGQDEANASHTQAWMRSTTRKASTHDSSPQCLAHAGLERRHRLFAAMKSLFYSLRKSTNP